MPTVFGSSSCRIALLRPAVVPGLTVMSSVADPFLLKLIEVTPAGRLKAPAVSPSHESL